MQLTILSDPTIYVVELLVASCANHPRMIVHCLTAAIKAVSTANIAIREIDFGDDFTLNIEADSALSHHLRFPRLHNPPYL
jgi:hypothetical protein